MLARGKPGASPEIIDASAGHRFADDPRDQ
jgi:hypothetical protein